MRTAYLAFGALSLTALGGCAGGGACAGPTSDFPFCDADEDREPSYQDNGPQRDGDDGESSGVVSDGTGAGGGSSGGDLDAASSDGGTVACSAAFPVCSGEAALLAVQGTTPSGPIDITRVALVYHEGSSLGTSLHFEASLGGSELLIVAFLDGSAHGSAVVAAGEYESSQADAGSALRVVGQSCDPETPLAARLTLDAHRRVDLDAEGGRLQGTLEVLEPGWSLEIPFELQQACAVQTD